MELLADQNLSADGHYAIIQLKPPTARPLLANAIGCHSLMLIHVNSVFTIPDPLGNDRGCTVMPK